MKRKNFRLFALNVCRDHFDFFALMNLSTNVYIRKALRPVLAGRSDLHVIHRKDILRLSHELRSNGQAWRVLWQEILRYVRGGIVNILILSVKRGVFSDCERCDEMLERMLQDMISPPPPDFVRMEDDKPRLIAVDLLKLQFAAFLLSSPPRPDCQSSQCSPNRPVTKGKYVATMNIYFKDAEFDVEFFSE